MLVFGLGTGLAEGNAVVEGKADELLTLADNFGVAEAAGFGQGQVIVFGMLDQMHDIFELCPRFDGLTLKALGQNDGQRALVGTGGTPNDGGVGACGAGGQNAVAGEGEGIAQHLD